jgi:hypothetical protein
MFGQRLTYRFRRRRPTRRLSRECRNELALRGNLGGLQFFQLQLQLFDLPLQLLRLAPKLHAPQLGDEQLQMLDLTFAREQPLLRSDQLIMLRQDQRLQSSGIEKIQVGERRKRGSHRRSMPSTRLRE